MVKRGAEVRTLDEFFRRLIVFDRNLAVIPASEDKPEGRFQAFELGVAAWLPGQPVSWNG